MKAYIKRVYFVKKQPKGLLSTLWVVLCFLNFILYMILAHLFYARRP